MSRSSPRSHTSPWVCCRPVIGGLRLALLVASCGAFMLASLADAVEWGPPSARRTYEASYADIPYIDSYSFSSALPLNPVVQALVDSVSEARLEASIVRLADFTTRHTNSDTTSATTGIGAARNWVYEQFAAYSALHGGVQTPGFFDFNATVCGIHREHRNVLAEQLGTVYPDRFYLAGAHLDSRMQSLCDAVSPAPGADDDASGVAATLELAYLLGRLETESSALFMVFTGEEQGIFGSTAYADFAAAGGMDIQAMISNDQVSNIFDTGGVADSVSCRSYSGGPGTSSSRQFTRYLKLKGEAYQPDFTVRLVPQLGPQGFGSDHQPFYGQGYASTWVIEAYVDFNHYHTTTDLPELLNFPYCARICRMNVAALASLLLAPATPAGTEVVDAGSGSEAFVSWDSNTELDLAGYRVAFRYEEGDSLFYQDVFDAGLSTSYLIGGLSAGVPVLVSVSAYDNDFNESVFGGERRVVPAMIPGAPGRFDATSRVGHVELTWDPSPELDVVSYNLYRATSRLGPFELLASVPVPLAAFDDSNVSPGTGYYYELAAVDADQNEGPRAGPVKGRLVDHAGDILVVDATIDGTGGSVPSDAQVDLFYQGMLSEAAVAGEWDRADSVAVGVDLWDADLGAHRTVVYHLDSFDVNVATQRDTAALRKYLQNGGRLLLSGSRVSFTLGGSPVSVNAWAPGQFMHDILKATETRQSLEFDLTGAFGQLPGYPDLDVDGSKILFDRLPLQDAYTGPLVAPATTEVLYRYQSLSGTGPNHQLPNAVRYLDDGLKLVAFSFPLYFMDSLSVRLTVATALADLGEITTAIVTAAAPPRLEFGLGGVVPNPFNPATRLEYMADRREHLTLRIYDVNGRLVRTLLDGWVEAGRHSTRWSGRTQGGTMVSSGVYFVELQGRGTDRVERRKIVMIR